MKKSILVGMLALLSACGSVDTNNVQTNQQTELKPVENVVRLIVNSPGCCAVNFTLNGIATSPMPVTVCPVMSAFNFVNNTVIVGMISLTNMNQTVTTIQGQVISDLTIRDATFWDYDSKEIPGTIEIVKF